MLELVEESKEMLKYAESGAWEKVSIGEEHRRRLLYKLFSETSEYNDVDEIDRIIREIIQINHKLEALTLAACELARIKTKSVVNGRNAINRYALHSS